MTFKKPKFWDLKKPNLISYLLLIFTLPIRINNLLLNFKKKKINKNIKVICVGNIYIGGTGKTPTTIKLYKVLKKLNFNVFTAKKFYKSHLDEEKILKENTNFLTGADRNLIIENNLKNENDLLIFDDGLQDKKASYDIQFVCFNEDNWIGNGQLIPSGPLREKLSSLKKYDAVFIKKEKNNKKLNHIHEVIKEINPNIKIFNTEYIVTNLNEFDLSKEYIIFSGIGSPNSFKDILIKKNFKIVNEIIYHDHFNYSEKNLKFIQDKAKDNNADIITTEKDFVKLSKFKYKNIKPLKVEINFLEEKSLINFIKSKLNE